MERKRPLNNLKGKERIHVLAKRVEECEMQRLLIGTLILIFTFIIILLMLRTSFVGFATFSLEKNYTDSIGLVFEQDSDFTWYLDNQGVLKSVKLSGSLTEGAKAKVYIQNDNISYLIFDSSLRGSLSTITGLVVLNETESIENIIIINETSINETVINETESIENLSIINETIINETLENQTTINESIINETAINETESIENISITKNIVINLKYKNNSSYDTDNDGIETLTGVVDFGVDAEFNWDVSYDQLCTKWEVYNQEESTIVCYGDEDCCSLLELVPERTSWNETFYLNYGKYGAGYNNKVTAQVIYANYSLEIPYSDIAYSDYESLTAKFLPTDIEFNDICIDTCLLTGFNSSSYKLIINVSNGSLSLREISYSILEEIVNKAPYLVKNISTIKINKNENITVDLSEYFIDPDNDELSYSYYGVENITVLIEDDIAVIVPDKDFTGRRYSYFTANDSSLIAVSDVFAIDVTEKEIKELEQLKAEINKPVKWVKRSKNLTITIPDYAYNLSINKIIDNNKSIIDKDKIKIKHEGKLKDLDEFEVDKKLEKTLKKEGKILTISETETLVLINETADSYEVGYETAAPESIEENITDYNKRITITAEINYTNVLAYTNILESPKSAIKLYWYKDDIKVDVTNDDTINLTFIDSNANNLIEQLEWIVPHLSNQTFEVEIVILNVQSYPTIGGNWTVRFDTSGVGNLTIRAVNGTSYGELYDDDSSSIDDLTLLELKCGNEILFNKNDLINEDNVYLINENNSMIKLNETIDKSIIIKKIKIINYNCSSIGEHTVKVLSEGVHTQEFNFSDVIAYAKNLAEAEIKQGFSELDNGSYNKTMLNITITAVTLTINDSEQELPNYRQNEIGLYGGINMTGNVLLFHFNNDSSYGENNTYVYDFSGTGSNGTAYVNNTDGSIRGANATGKLRNAFYFDGIDDYVEVSDNNLNLTVLSIEFWFKPEEDYDSNTDYISLVYHNDYEISISNGNMVFSYDGSNISSSTNTWSKGQWYHIIATCDGSTQTIYVNSLGETSSLVSSPFRMKNSAGTNVASFFNSGNIILKGSCSAGSCSHPGDDAFIIQDSSGDTVAYIDSNGDLCVEDSDCNDQDSNCDTPGDGSFIIQNKRGVNVAYINSIGALCLKGTLTQNGNP